MFCVAAYFDLANHRELRLTSRLPNLRMQSPDLTPICAVSTIDTSARKRRRERTDIFHQ